MQLSFFFGDWQLREFMGLGKQHVKGSPTKIDTGVLSELPFYMFLL